MSDDTEKKNVFSIVKDGKKKSKTPIITLTIVYKDGVIDHQDCHYFGESVEVPGLLITGWDEAPVPTAFYNLDCIRRIDIEQN